MSKVLVVEDSESMRQMTSVTLQKAGYDVTEAVDGLDGLQKAEAEQFDAVLMDMNMPGKNGLELTKDLRAKDNYRATPIIMLTTESAFVLKQEGRFAGVTGWIVKPFQPRKLLEAVQRVL